MTVRRLILSAALVLCWLPTAMASGPRTVVSSGSARVQVDSGDSQWTVGNDLVTLLIGLDRESGFSVQALTLPGTDRRLELGNDSDHDITVGSEVTGFGRKADGWTFVEAATSEAEGSVRLAFTYRHNGHGLRATRWYAASSNTPTIETWTTLEALNEPVAIDGLSLWHVVVQPGDIDWLTGLHPPEGAGESFTRQRSHLEPGDQLNLGAQGRSSEFMVPWFAVDQGPDTLYVGLMWSGAWGVSVRRTDDSLRLSVGLPATVTTVEPGVDLDTPHLFLGVARGPSADVAAALRPFLRDTLRRGRGWDPLVTYNTWFAYGTHVDEEVVLEEIRANAALGTELFVLDAGWYTGHHEYWDFTPGLGTWEADADRFPHGLAVLGDDARSRGLKFGIWVEPERVDLETVYNRGTVKERWLASRDGLYDPNLSFEDTAAAQICLSDAEARQWLYDRLVQFIEENRPDYLKWDNNLWVNCNRPDHGHGPDDGNFKHVQGLYALLAAVRERFPGLIIENVSGGGNRMDFGMARLTDVGWMDDQSSPAVHVRHNLQGLSQVFPSAYLLSFIMPHGDEPVDDSSDLSMYVRSRMPGMLGLCLRSHQLDDDTMAALAREIDLYKSLRDVLRNGTTALLTPQARSGVDGGWDAVQATSPESDRTVLFVYQQDDGVDDAVIRPMNLVADRLYLVSTVDDGEIGTALGADLMEQGLGLHDTSRSAAHIVILTPATGNAAKAAARGR